MLFISKDSDPKTINIIINGCGLVGLASLVDLLARVRVTPDVFFEITMIEKRTLRFTRGQKIILIDDESINQGINWIDFCEKNFFPTKLLKLTQKGELLVDDVIPDIKTSRYLLVQKLLRQKAQSTHPVNISIKQLQEALLEQINDSIPKNFNITWYLKSCATRIDVNNSILTVTSEEDSKEIFFHVLMNCEGEKRQTVDLINKKALRAKTFVSAFQYEELEHTDSYHMAVKIKIKEPESGTYNAFIQEQINQYKSDTQKQEQVNRFVQSKVIINEHELAVADLPFLYDPNDYKQKFFIEHWVPKYFVAGLIPRAIHDIEDPSKKRQVLLKWASYLLAYNYKMDPDIFILDTTEYTERILQQRANTFTSKIKAVYDPVMVLPNNSVIVLLGDACMSPYYWEGISSTIGLNEALSFLDCIFEKNKQKNDPYHELRRTYTNYKAFIVECLSSNTLEKRKQNTTIEEELPSSGFYPR